MSAKKIFKKIVIPFLIAGVVTVSSVSCDNKEKSGVNDSTEKNAAAVAVLGDIKSEKALNVNTEGTSEIKTVDCEMGGYSGEYSVRTLEKKGSSLSFDLKKTGKGDITLEIEEIHQRSDESFAYLVKVNGSSVYYRTYNPNADSMNSYFVLVPESLAKEETFTVTFVSDCDREIRFHSIRAYSDMDALLESEKTYQNLKIALFQPSCKDSSPSLKALKDTYAKETGYDIVIGYDIFYFKSTLASVTASLDSVLMTAAKSQIPVFLDLNSWWGGTVGTVMDGKGGFFQDTEYQQLVYDPLNANGRGNFQFSVPNMWSNTPWLTMNNNNYNLARANRLTKVVEHIQKRIAEFEANGNPLPEVMLFTENEPDYWHYSAFNNSPKGGGDFSQSVVEDAAAQGVKLDPTDGLDSLEMEFLRKNLGTYISEVGDAIADGAGYNITVVTSDKIINPSYQLIENSYSQGSVAPNYPYLSEDYMFYEQFVQKNIRFGYEGAAGFNDTRSYEYANSYGKYSGVNLEGFSEGCHDFIKTAYLYGSTVFQVFNYKDEEMLKMPDWSDFCDTAAPVGEHNNQILSYDFNDEDSLALNDSIVAYENIYRSNVSSNGVTPVSGDEKGGSITFRLDNKGAAFDNGASVTINGRILSDIAPSLRMELYAGSSKDSLTLVDTFNILTPNTFDISDAIDKTKSEAFVQIKMFSMGAGDLTWCSVYSIKGYSNWAEKTGTMCDSAFTYRQLRSRYLFAQNRADLARMLETYKERAGENETYKTALDCYNTAHYTTGYKLILTALSQSLPATYLVVGKGSLGDYPVAVNTGADKNRAFVTVTEYSDNSITVSLSSNSMDGNVTLSSTAGKKLTSEKTGEGIYKITMSDSGEASVSLEVVRNSYKTAVPDEFEGKALDGTGLSQLVFTTQDTTITDYAESTTIPVAADCKVYVGNDSDSDSDMREAKMGDVGNGMYIRVKTSGGNAVEIRAYAGHISGTVTKVEQLTVFPTSANAFVTLRDEATGKEKRFEIGSECRLAFEGATGERLDMTTIGNIGIKEGQHLTIDYCPYVYGDREMRALIIAD